jgi:hypothetical protein
MEFDPCPHKMTQLVLKAGTVIRELKGLPKEENITLLYNETAPLLGLAPQQMGSIEANKFPAPSEMTDPKGKLIIPRMDCPECKNEKGMLLGPLCSSCADAEGGKFKSMWKCNKCGYKIKSEQFFTKLLIELGVEFGTGTKEEMGIKTYTDEGLK